MVLWYGRSCKEMCEAILWVSQQDDPTTLQSIYSLHRWSPLQRRRNELCCMLSNCSEMFSLARIGRPDILWSVNKLARSITNGPKLVWQTPESCLFFGSVSQISDRTGRPVDVERNEKSHGNSNVMENIDSVPSSVQSSSQDNEAVIKMIIKGRSPTMRHVSRTHRVALDWVFHRIDLDPKNQIKHIDTKTNSLTLLTKGHFTRDEWNHLLCLFNISHFDSTDCFEVMSRRTRK